MVSDRGKRRIERLLDEADDAAVAQNWNVVRARAETVLAFDPGNGDALELIAAADRASDVPSTANSSEDVIVDPDSQSFSEPPLSSDTPTSYANGRYAITSFLGEGGKKQVYLAQDTLLDRDVAFALIKTEGLDDVARTRISREAQAMGRLGSHPHIVTVFDLGDHDGQPFMVTELMGGGDVEAIIEDAPEHRLSLEQAIRIAVETCRGLEFAHSRGIVHRDLKPGNVWLTQDGTAKIGDFGLAVATDRSRLTQEGMMVGTVSYMPPEQAMGGETTAQADLYSLGAMLYEMVAGRPPFLGDDSVAIIGRHINTPPVAPTWHRQECPKLLEALILRLLAKNPAERPNSATDVLTALEGIDLAARPVTTDSDEVEANALDSLAGGVFVGRHAEMGELKAALEDALSGRGRMVTLVGEPGIGKTRIAQELATYASLRGAQVLWGRCYEEQGVPPYWPWVQAIRSYVAERGPEELASIMGAGAADIAEIVSDVKQRLPGLQAPPQLDSPEQARFRLFDSITAFLKNASRSQPIMLVLDDLHWADKPSLLLLQFITRELAGTRLLLVGTYRDMELNRQHPLAETLGDLTRERLFQRVLLRGLSQDDVGRFIETTSGISPPAGLVQAVHTQTEGNPLFVTEVVRLLVQEGELAADKVGERDSWTVRIPEGVREVIGRRLNQLSQRCNETLTVASVIGREFELRQLDKLLDDLTEDMLLDVLEEGLSARVIEELPTSVGHYQFTHALIQETLSEELSLTRRVRVHARIAEALEELYGIDADSHAAELVHHFAQAEMALGADKLVHYSALAGERALGNYAYEEAVTHFERALAVKEGLPMGSEKADLLLGLCQAQFATLPRGRRALVHETLKEVFDYSVENGETFRAIAIAEQSVPLDVGITTTFDELYERALQLVPNDSLSAGRILANYGRVLGNINSDYDGAQTAFDQGLEIAQRERDAALEMRILSQSGIVDVRRLRFAEGLVKTLRTLELAQQLDDIRTERSARFNAVMANVFLGNLEEARLHSVACVATSERIHDRTDLIDAFTTVIWVAYCEGQWDSIRSAADQGQALVPQSIEMLSHRVVAEYGLSEFDLGDGSMERLVESLESTGFESHLLNTITAMAIARVARIAGRDHHLDLARRMAEATIVPSENATPLHVMQSQSVLALLAVIEEDSALAEEQYVAIKSWQIHTLLGPSVTSMDDLLGLLAQTIGNFDDAEGHFEDALAFCRKAAYRPALAWSLCDYADMLLERNDDGDHQKAMALLDESLQISTELGMSLLMERVLSRREILKA